MTKKIYKQIRRSNLKMFLASKYYLQVHFVLLVISTYFFYTH